MRKTNLFFSDPLTTALNGVLSISDFSQIWSSDGDYDIARNLVVTTEDVFTGTSGDDVLNGTTSDDTLYGLDGNDQLYGSSGNDTLYGGAGDDRFDGGFGDDVFIIEAGHHTLGDLYYGGNGSDTLINDAGANFVNDNWAYYGGDAGNSVEFVDLNGFQFYGTANGDNFSFNGMNFLNLPAGTHVVTLAGDDVVQGSGTQDLSYDLGGGADSFTAVGGLVDTVYGGLGNDSINGGSGNDILTGGAGDDILDGSFGDDTLIIEAGDHTVDDQYFGGNNIDTFVNNSMADVIVDNWAYYGGNAGNAIEFLDMNGYRLIGTAGNDTISVHGLDILNRHASVDVATLDGNDAVQGSSTQDLVYELGDGTDQFDANGSTVDTVRGGGGNDDIDGGSGNDILYGGAGDDIISGSFDNDTIIIEAGHHTLADQYFGGNDTDTFVNNSAANVIVDNWAYYGGNAGNAIELFDLNGFQLEGTSGNDTISVHGVDFLNRHGSVDVLTQAGDDTVQGSSTQDLVYELGSGADAFDGVGAIDDTVYGGDDADDIFGSSGNDILYGGAGDDIIDGSFDDDIIIIEAGHHTVGDRYYGGNNVDTFLNNSGMNVIVDNWAYYGGDAGNGIEFVDLNGFQLEGTAGNDSISLNGLTLLNLVASVDVLTQAGDDSVQGSAFQDLVYDLGADADTFNGVGAIIDTVYGGAGNDNLNGSSGDDWLYGGAGDDILSGGFDNDMFEGGAGADSLVGSSGTDTATYENSAAGVTIDLNDNSNNEGGDAEGDTLSGVENLIGSAFDDIFIGNGFSNVMEGGAGADSMYGGSAGALDTLSYASSSSAVTVNVVTNTASGGDAQGDVFAGFESLIGSAFNDTLTVGGLGVLEGGAGADVMTGGGNPTTLSYLSSSAGVNVNLASGTGSGGDAQGDTFTGFTNLWGSAFDDVLRGTTGRNEILGGSGDDRIISSDGNDELYGEGGNDIIFGENGDDDMFGGDGDDNIAGGSGDDELRGGNGNDTLNGQADDDLMYGDNGDDVLIGSFGEDSLYGGSGVDLIYGGSDNDLIRGGNDMDTLVGASGDDTIYGDNHDDAITGQVGNDTLYGGSGDDVLSGQAGNDVMNGDNGADTLNGGGGNDALNGGNQDDIINGGSGLDLAYGGAGDDLINGGSQADELHGDAGIDTINGGAGNDMIFGDAGEDILSGQSGSDTIYGGAEDDELYGGSGSDDLFGGDGADIISGGGGNDILWGDAGADIFALAQGFGVDRISDFENGVDLIDFSSNALVNDFSDVMADAVELGTSVRIELNANNTLIIENFDLADLDASDFIF